MAHKEPARRSARLRNAERNLASRLLLDVWAGTGAPMTIQQDIDALRARVQKAQIDCEAWRLTGTKEKYLEAYFLVEALTSQLDEYLKNLTTDTPVP